MPRAGLRSIPSGSNPVVAARSNARANTGHSRFATDGVPWPASRSRACLCPPFTGTRARPPAAFFQVPRAAYLSGHRRPAAPVRKTLVTVQRRTDMRPGCQDGAASSPMPARRDGSRAHWPCGRTAHLRRDSPAPLGRQDGHRAAPVEPSINLGMNPSSPRGLPRRVASS